MGNKEYLIVTKPSSTHRHYKQGAGVYETGAVSLNPSENVRMIVDSLASTPNSLESSLMPLNVD
jgi:hypothetical protein